VRCFTKSYLKILFLFVLLLFILVFPIYSASADTGGKIAFANRADGDNEIYIMNADGTSQTRLTNNNYNDRYPSWSPDGKKIAFYTERDGNSEIYIMNADGTSQTRLTNNIDHDMYPSWSPDGTKIAFVTEREHSVSWTQQIYIMNADGTSQTNISNNYNYDSFPNWSPDGTKIAFTSNRNSNDEIYIMNADGTSQTRLTNNNYLDTHPNWSHDGTKIAFTSKRDGNNEIYIMNADGTSQTRLTNNIDNDIFPDWSPDGTKIAIAGDTGQSYSDIYVINADGSARTNISHNSYSYSKSDWIRNTPTPTDTDKDGIPDSSDSCPTQAETVNGFQDTDGCPDVVPPKDTDGDGISDSFDQCPTQAETVNGYQDTDGCPDVVPPKDTDGDGIPDSSDSCPTQAETVNGYQDTDGCPDVVPIKDTIPPVIVVPNNMAIQATSNNPSPVTFSVSATDDKDGSVTPICSPKSGSNFAVGTTTVSCTATDIAGNVGKASFTVTVTEATPKDTDGDGIPDSSDSCPTQAETINNYQDTDGCLDVVPPTQPPVSGLPDLREYLPTRDQIGTSWKYPTNQAVYDEAKDIANQVGFQDSVWRGHLKGSGFDTNFMDLYIYRFDSATNAKSFYGGFVSQKKSSGGYEEWFPNIQYIGAENCYGRIVSGSYADKVALYCISQNYVTFVLSAGMQYDLQDKLPDIAKAVFTNSGSSIDSTADAKKIADAKALAEQQAINAKKVTEVKKADEKKDTLSVMVGDKKFSFTSKTTGTSITKISADTDFMSLILNVITTGNPGILEITFERSFFDSTLQGSDDNFIVLADGDEPKYSEIKTTPQSRTLSIKLPTGTEKVEIIGSQFGQSVSKSVPVACTLKYVPVCGVDGVTYGNKCQLNAAKINQDYLGECIVEEKPVALNPTNSKNNLIKTCGEGTYLVNGVCKIRPDQIKTSTITLTSAEPKIMDSNNRPVSIIKANDVLFVNVGVENLGKQTEKFVGAYRYIPASTGKWSEWTWVSASVNAGKYTNISIPWSPTMKDSYAFDIQIWDNEQKKNKISSEKLTVNVMPADAKKVTEVKKVDDKKAAEAKKIADAKRAEKIKIAKEKAKERALKKDKK
jgi:hypothetical protein